MKTYQTRLNYIMAERWSPGVAIRNLSHVVAMPDNLHRLHFTAYGKPFCIVVMRPGDWLIVGLDGSLTAMPDKQFQAMYEERPVIEIGEGDYYVRVPSRLTVIEAEVISTTVTHTYLPKDEPRDVHTDTPEPPKP